MSSDQGNVLTVPSDFAFLSIKLGIFCWCTIEHWFGNEPVLHLAETMSYFLEFVDMKDQYYKVLNNYGCSNCHLWKRCNIISNNNCPNMNVLRVFAFSSLMQRRFSLKQFWWLTWPWSIKLHSSVNKTCLIQITLLLNITIICS